MPGGGASIGVPIVVCPCACLTSLHARSPLPPRARKIDEALPDDGGEPVTVPGVHVAAMANRLRSWRDAVRGDEDRSMAEADEKAVVVERTQPLPPAPRTDALGGSANEGVATGAGSGGARRTTNAYR